MSNGTGDFVLGKTLKNIYNTSLRSFSTVSTNKIIVNNLTTTSINLPFLKDNVFTNVQINDSIGNFTELNSANVSLTGGYINNTVIGNIIPSSGTFSSLNCSGLTNLNDNLYVNGSIYCSNLITGYPQQIFPSENNMDLKYSYETISVSGGTTTAHPDTSKNISYITVNSSGIAQGTMPSGSYYGQWKLIVIENLESGASYRLTFPSGKLITSDGNSTGVKTLNFVNPGQSVKVIYNQTQSRWSIISNNGVNFI